MVGKTAFEQWFEGLAPLALDANSIKLGVSDDFFADWLNDNYADILANALKEAAGRELKFSFESGHAPRPRQEEAPQACAKAFANEGEPEEVEAKNELGIFGRSGRYTFKNFVMGEENRYACTAAMTAAQSPGLYNPLYIYGSTGLGKTHLLQAVSDYAIQRNPGAVVEYVTCEEFLNKYVESLKNKSHAEFRNRFRKVDMLLVDDVHHLGNKGALQEEFFNTFNTLHHANKQIIMTSDKQPSEIHGLEARLLSRFQSGVSTEITKPSYETRLAILRMKQEGHQVKLGEDILSFIASKVSSSVRHLEGALMRLVAYSSVSGGVKVDISTAEMLLRDLIDQESAARAVSIESIQRLVAERFNIQLSDLVGPKRPRNIAEPRMIAMYLSRKLTNHSLPEIGLAFGRNHATVIHGVNQIESACEKNDDMRRAVDGLRRQLQGC
jgi:chromosomal replication initiator protein